MELPIRKLKLTRHEKIVPDLNKKDFNDLKRSIEKWGIIEPKGVLLAGPQDAESSFNETVDFEGKEWTATNSVHRVPAMQRAQIASGWAGLYDISPDHHAIIGAFPELPGFICANGFSGHGFQHSPAAGMLLAELIVEGKATTIDIKPLRPQRFREGDLIQEPLVAFLD